MTLVIYIIAYMIAFFVIGTVAGFAIMWWSEDKEEKNRTPKVHNRWPGI